MQTITTIAALREQLRSWRGNGERIAFVPTMGNLHAGHLHLITEARKRARRCVASIFVNPLQFGAGEDFQTYPRTLTEDSTQLAAAGVDVLFAPTVDEMYPAGATSQLRVEVGPLGDILCGQSRPG
ncbi:MAG: pantoate--beta-alanine ligase, partial [Gammaproteobacteria bacterium]